MSRAKKSPKAPGKAHRDGISLFDLERMFPDEAAAEHWLEKARWGDEDRPCPYCGSIGTYRVKSRKPLPFRCRDCKRYFSVRVGTPLERSHIPLRKWVYGIYIWMTSLKGVSSMKLHRDLDISQRSAWFMAHRLREAFAFGGGFFSGPVEIDEVYMGGKYRNMSKKRRKTMSGRGRGSGGKSTIVGIKDRPTKQVAAQVVPNLKGETLRAYIMERIHPETTVYTDELRVYGSLNFEVHETVRHGINEYVRGDAHTNGIESFWSMLKRAHTGTFHKISTKHIHKYLAEFVGRHNLRDKDTLAQMEELVARMGGHRLLYKDLVA